VRIIVTGGRAFTDAALVGKVLDAFFMPEIAVGDYPGGVDELVAEWAKRMSIVPTVHRAYSGPDSWEVHGKAAGGMRNQRMVDAGADLCIAFPGGKGTDNCAKKARKAGIPVLRVEV
jgi:hypothetical protein